MQLGGDLRVRKGVSGGRRVEDAANFLEQLQI